MTPDDPKPMRSPRAALNEQQARVTRAVLGFAIVAVLAAAGWGVTWLRELRGTEARSPESRPESAPATRDGSHEPAAATRGTATTRSFQAERAIAGIRERFPQDSVENAWQASLALRAQAAEWKAAGAPAIEVDRLLAAAFDSENWIVSRKPSFPDLRRARGEVRWPEVLGDFEDFATRFLTKAEAERLTRATKELDRVADHNHGWIARSEYEAVAAPLVKKAVEAHRAFDAMLATRAGRAAREVEIRDLAALRNDLPTTRFRPFYHLPYVVLVERAEGWEEEEPAARLARILLGLRTSFFDAYGAATGLAREDQRPVPVVLFKSRESYQRYRLARKSPDVAGIEAHFEHVGPSTGRLVVHDECSVSTILHEGTHQLIHANVRKPLATYAQSFWFHEGIAEWFAGSRPLADGPDGLPRFEPGALLPRDLEPGAFLGPLAVLRATPPEKRLPLARLVGLMLKEKDALEAAGPAGASVIHLVYAQGWFLIYFLEHFDADESGFVRFGPGRYREAWLRYLKREMEGASGEATFFEVMRGAGLTPERLEREMKAYLDFVLAKVAKGHVRGQVLVPWNEAPAREGKPAAKEADDRIALGK